MIAFPSLTSRSGGKNQLFRDTGSNRKEFAAGRMMSIGKKQEKHPK